MLKLLSEITHKKTTDEQKEVLGYKKALDQISQNWPGEEVPVQAKDLIELHKLIGSGRLRVPLAGLQHLLDYLQARPTSPATLPDSASLGRRGELADGRARAENPIIQAGIVVIEMEKMQLFTESNKLIANLASLIFLSKLGYDFRGFLAYEKEWIEDVSFRENHKRALSAVSLTLWLEYFAQSILNRAEQLLQSIEKPKAAMPDLRKSFWELNERQKSIISFLDSPQATITNRQIQKRFKTSQITASRDLAKLTNLGFLFSHGKGRSVYYSRVSF
jgi:Fic family protein